MGETMKGVLTSLRGLFPKRETEESGTMVAMHTNELAEPVEATPAEIKREEQPVLEQASSRPVRQMVEMSDIAAAHTEPDAAPDPMDSSLASVPPNPALEALVMEAIKTVRDPEIPVNLVDLGLIYEFDVDMNGQVLIEMTLTTPNCPSAADLPIQVEQAARGVEGVKDVRVKLVFTPPWHQDLMSEEARLELGLL